MSGESSRSVHKVRKQEANSEVQRPQILKGTGYEGGSVRCGNRL